MPTRFSIVFAAVVWVVPMTVLASAPAGATCADTIFADDFEAGNTSRWSNSSAPARATGTWTFTLDFDGSTRAFALELIERVGGDVTGVLLGGTALRVLVQGSVTASTLSLELELVHPEATRTVLLEGTLGAEQIVATATGDLGMQAATLSRVDCELFIYELAAATPELEHVVEMGVVVDSVDDFVAGSFVGSEDCVLWGCDGGLTSFSEVGDVITAGLETDGGCSAGSSFMATWGSGGLYNGSYSFTDCEGTESGDLVAAFGSVTTSLDVRSMLQTRVRVAEALEAGVPLGSPLPTVSPTYLHFGKDESTLRSELNAEMTAYDSIRVELLRARNPASYPHPRALPDLVRSVGLEIAERRIGTPSGGVDPVIYRDSVARPIIDDLAVIRPDGGNWVVIGNQVAALDLPFLSTVSADGKRLVAPTAAGQPVWVTLGSYGAHFFPLSGDPSGERKANFVGFLAEDDTEMEELEGDGDGVREPGEVWGFPIGGDLSGNSIRLRRPAYVAPADGAVHSIVYEEAFSPIHFDNEGQWLVVLALPGGVRYRMGHVGQIASELGALVLAATGVDPASFAGPEGTDLLEGFDPIPVGTGTELALPQILAGPVPGHPGYWAGEGTFLEWPWAQIEFSVPFSGGGGSDYCVFRFFSAQRRAELQSVMAADMLDSSSQRYRDRPFYEAWPWRAQGGLCQAENGLPDDFSALYTRLGGWFGRPETGTPADELFSYIPIDTTTTVYDPALYDSAAVQHLVVRARYPDPWDWTLPDSSVVEVLLAKGEVLEQTESTMLIKWRDLALAYPAVYQRVAYALNDEGLAVAWGALAATRGAAVQPVLPPGDPCDSTTVSCYDHSQGAWPP